MSVHMLVVEILSDCLPFLFVQQLWRKASVQWSEGVAECAMQQGALMTNLHQDSSSLLDIAAAWSSAHSPTQGLSHCSHCGEEVQQPGYTYTCFIPPCPPPGPLLGPAFSISEYRGLLVGSRYLQPSLVCSLWASVSSFSFSLSKSVFQRFFLVLRSTVSLLSCLPECLCPLFFHHLSFPSFPEIWNEHSLLLRVVKSAILTENFEACI